MTSLYSLGRDEGEIRRKTKEDFSLEMQLSKENFNMTCKIFDSIGELFAGETVPKVFVPVVFMMPRLISTIKSILNLVMNGYYYDARILERSFLENLGLCVYLAGNEEYAMDWIKGKKIEVAYIRLMKEIFSLWPIQDKKYIDGLYAIYGDASGFVHAEARAVLAFIEKKEPGYKPLLLRYQKEAVSSSIVFVAPALLNTVLVRLLRDRLDKNMQRRVTNLATKYLAKTEDQQLQQR